MEKFVVMQAGPTMLDGNLLAQFLELTSMQQEAVLTMPSDFQSSRAPSISINEVIRVLERVHYALSWQNIVGAACRNFLKPRWS